MLCVEFKFLYEGFGYYSIYNVRIKGLILRLRPILNITVKVEG
jgi:hypothetical protein